MSVWPVVAVVGAVAVSAGAWFVRKMIRAAPYQIGAVARAAAADEAVGGGDAFDEPGLVKASTDSVWRMPGGIEVHHFGPEGSSSSSSSTTAAAAAGAAAAGGGVGDDDASSGATKAEPVLCVHGGPGLPPARAWAAAGPVGTLSEGALSLRFIHTRGCGQSTRPFAKWPTPRMWPGIQQVEGGLGLGAQVADLERGRRRMFAERDGEDEKMVLVGHSFGGFVATLYAAEFPQHIKALVLLAPASVLQLPRPKGDADMFEQVGEMQPDADSRAAYAAFRDRYFDMGSMPSETEASLAARQEEFGAFYARALGKKGPEELGGTPPASTGGFATYASFFSMGMEHDWCEPLRQKFAETTFPVIIVHGDADMAPTSDSEKYKALFPSDNVELRILSGVDHFLPESAPEPVAQAIVDAVARANKAE